MLRIARFSFIAKYVKFKYVHSFSFLMSTAKILLFITMHHTDLILSLDILYYIKVGRNYHL